MVPNVIYPLAIEWSVGATGRKLRIGIEHRRNLVTGWKEGICRDSVLVVNTVTIVIPLMSDINSSI